MALAKQLKKKCLLDIEWTGETKCAHRLRIDRYKDRWRWGRLVKIKIKIFVRELKKEGLRVNLNIIRRPGKELKISCVTLRKRRNAILMFVSAGLVTTHRTKNWPDVIMMFVSADLVTIQKRQDDPWLSGVLEQCRNGSLSLEDYYFFVGVPTEHCGSWLSSVKTNTCGSRDCAALATEWRRLAEEGASWRDMVRKECDMCNAERQRRNILIQPQDARIRGNPFIDAPYIHQHNEPKCHALLPRAVEHAKRGGGKPAHIS